MILHTVKPLIQVAPNPKPSMFLISCYCSLRPIHWSQVLSLEWRYSWSSADRRCSNYIWVINNFIVYKGAIYIRDLKANTLVTIVWRISQIITIPLLLHVSMSCNLYKVGLLMSFSSCCPRWYHPSPPVSPVSQHPYKLFHFRPQGKLSPAHLYWVFTHYICEKLIGDISLFKFCQGNNIL